MTFDNFEIHPLIVKGLPWDNPLPVQKAAIPPILEGKNVALRSRTGSGKTAAYLIPILHRLICCHVSKALILTPTKELCHQVCRMAHSLTSYCSQISISNTCISKYMESVNPHLIICTSASIPNSVYFEIIVLDEADLIIEFDCLDELNCLSHPKQLILVSATLNDLCIKTFRNLLLNVRDTFVHITQRNSLPPQLLQFSINCPTDEDKYLLLVSLIKLEILFPFPILIFLSSTDRAYRLRLVFEQFKIRACSFNKELPEASRYHVLEEFNKGIYDVLLTTEHSELSPRGLDFRPVTYVINFDVPNSVESYIHRVGRTARLDNNGTAISLVGVHEQKFLESIRSAIGTDVLKNYSYPIEQVEGFRYRVRDAMRIVTKNKVRDARIKEIKHEMLISAKLMTYFDDHERDLAVLSRHDRPLFKGCKNEHLGHVPRYIIPSGMKKRIQRKKVTKFRRRPVRKRINPLLSSCKAAKDLRNLKVS